MLSCTSIASYSFCGAAGYYVLSGALLFLQLPLIIAFRSRLESRPLFSSKRLCCPDRELNRGLILLCLAARRGFFHLDHHVSPAAPLLRYPRINNRQKLALQRLLASAYLFAEPLLNRRSNQRLGLSVSHHSLTRHTSALRSSTFHPPRRPLTPLPFVFRRQHRVKTKFLRSARNHFRKAKRALGPAGACT